MERYAVISECGQYRYSLVRKWAVGKHLTFVMLNPSTADATVDDATIRKCIGFAKRYGYASIYVYNLYAFRATKPKDLFVANDPVGPANDNFLRYACDLANLGEVPIVCAWGGNATGTLREKEVVSLLKSKDVQMAALHICKDGITPGHPLMLSYDRELITI
jgi:hypothetical protein